MQHLPMNAVLNPLAEAGNIPSTLLNGLAAYWTLNETSSTRFDSTSNHNDLTPENSPTSTTGMIGNALRKTTGSTQRLSIAHNSTLAFTSTMSLAFWVRSSSVAAGTRAGVFARGTTNTTIVDFQTGQLNWALGTGLGTLAFKGSFLSANTWTHTVMTYDGTQTGNSNRVQFYKNGVSTPPSFVGTIPATCTDNQTLYVGWDSPEAGGITVDVDEFGLWNRTLTAAEASTLYNSGTGLSYPF